MQRIDLIYRPELIEAFEEGYLHGFLTEKQMNDLKLVTRIQQCILEASPNTDDARYDLTYEKLARCKDIYLSDLSIRDIDQRWRKEISREEFLERLQHLDPVSQKKWLRWLLSQEKAPKMTK